MFAAAFRYKILAHMFSRTIRDLDQIQNSSTAHACTFDQSKIDIAKDAINEVVEELEARADEELGARFAPASLPAIGPTAPGGCGAIFSPKGYRVDCIGSSD